MEHQKDVNPIRQQEETITDLNERQSLRGAGEFIVRDPKQILRLRLEDFHLGPAHCLKNTQVVTRGGTIAVGIFKRSTRTWFYNEYSNAVRLSWKGYQDLKISQCSVEAFQKIQFCMSFLCNGGVGGEVDGSIRRYWQENQEDIEASLDKLMHDIEESLEKDELHNRSSVSTLTHQSNFITLPSSSSLDEPDFLVARKKRRLSSANGASAPESSVKLDKQENKAFEDLFKAYSCEVKRRERLEEKLRVCKKQLSLLERTVYPRGMFENVYDHSFAHKSSSVSQFGDYLVRDRTFSKLIDNASSNSRNGFKKDVEKFIREFYSRYSGRIHNQIPREFRIYADDYNDPAEVCGLCLLFDYFKQDFRYYAPGSDTPSKSPYLS